MKVRDVMKRLKKAGWYRIPAKGGHRQFKHRVKPGRVTVSGGMNDDVDPGTLKSIWDQAQLPRIP